MEPNLKEPSLHIWQQIVQSALHEDRSEHDVTTQSTVLNGQIGTGVLRFKQNGTLAGMKAAETAFKYMDPDIQLSKVLPDGTQVKNGSTIAIVEGTLQGILSAERVALNLLQRLSGVATLTAQMVSQLSQYPNVSIVDTRKTTPGLRSEPCQSERERERWCQFCAQSKSMCTFHGNISLAAMAANYDWPSCYHPSV